MLQKWFCIMYFHIPIIFLLMFKSITEKHNGIDFGIQVLISSNFGLQSIITH